MKLRGPFEIHALIGRCHLHNKQLASYSVTLKIGNKASAITEFKYPVDDEVNFNTELILKIDRTVFEGHGKLSIIVTMLTEDRQKKIMGSAVANFKQKGMQNLRISNCSCKDRGLEVSVEFQVVNIQNQNIIQNNNKFQSPNNPEMKDLKKTLTISHQKELVKSSRVKQTAGIKASTEKTQVKVNRQKQQKNTAQSLSPNLSSLTTKISSPQMKVPQQSSSLVSQLRTRILQLQTRLESGLCDEKVDYRHVQRLQKQMETLRRQNECLIQILKYEEQKSSAAIEYISYLSNKITDRQTDLNQYQESLRIIENVKKDPINDTSSAIKLTKNKSSQDYSFQIKSKHQNNQKLLSEIQNYQKSINKLTQKLKHLQSAQKHKIQTIQSLQKSIAQANKQNAILKSEIQKLNLSINSQQSEIKSFQLIKKNLEDKIKILEKSLNDNDLKQKQLTQKLNTLTFNNSKSLKQNSQLKSHLSEAQKKINQLKQYQLKFELLIKQNEKLKLSLSKTPPESQIQTRKSRFEDGQDIQNLINQMNRAKNLAGKELLLASRNIQDRDNFLVRNKSESLLKDMEMDPDSEGPNTEQTSKQICKTAYKNKLENQGKISKKIQIPDPKKQVKKYNYEYDIDSLNYFNNFEENHEGIGLSEDVYQLEPDQGKV